jgi:hypothetical protein
MDDRLERLGALRSNVPTKSANKRVEKVLVKLRSTLVDFKIPVKAFD